VQWRRLGCPGKKFAHGKPFAKRYEALLAKAELNFIEQNDLQFLEMVRLLTIFNDVHV
jgi:hypothetical protein